MVSLRNSHLLGQQPSARRANLDRVPASWLGYKWRHAKLAFLAAHQR